MLIVTGTIWPRGNQAQSYEVLHISMNNTSGVPDAAVDSYAAHVLHRPQPFGGIRGYEADVEVPSYDRTQGLGPLLMSVLGAAHASAPDEDIVLPPARTLARVELIDAHQFEAILRGRKP